MREAVESGESQAGLGRATQVTVLLGGSVVAAAAGFGAFSPQVFSGILVVAAVIAAAVMLRTRRVDAAVFAVGMVGIAVSDATMHLRMTSHAGPGYTAITVVGAIGAFLGYAGFIAWAVSTLGKRAGNVGRGAVLDGVTLAAGATLLFGVEVLLPQLRATDTSNLDQLLFVGCLAADIVLVWATLLLASANPGSRRASLLAVGVGLHVVVDVLHVLMGRFSSMTLAHVAEALSVFTFVLWIFAAFSSTEEQRASQRSMVLVSKVRVVALLVTFFSPAFVLAMRLWGADRTAAILVLSVSAGLALAVALRTQSLAKDLRSAHDELRHQASHDSLTGIANRSVVLQTLSRLGKPTEGDLVAVLYLDLNGFKAVNDNLGHAAGDSVLVEVASRLSGATRDHDIVARMGGDEFVVLLLNINEEGISSTRLRVENEVNAEPYLWSGIALDVTASLGVASFNIADRGIEGFDPDALLAQADSEMLRNKRLSKVRPEAIAA